MIRLNLTCDGWLRRGYRYSCGCVGYDGRLCRCLRWVPFGFGGTAPAARRPPQSDGNPGRSRQVRWVPLAFVMYHDCAPEGLCHGAGFVFRARQRGRNLLRLPKYRSCLFLASISKASGRRDLISGVMQVLGTDKRTIKCWVS